MHHRQAEFDRLRVEREKQIQQLLQARRQERDAIRKKIFYVRTEEEKQRKLQEEEEARKREGIIFFIFYFYFFIYIFLISKNFIQKSLVCIKHALKAGIQLYLRKIRS